MTDPRPARLDNQLSALELATGFVRGLDPSADALPEVVPGSSARDALEEAVRRALLRPPCVVSFSGGRDSSAVLALASHVARQEGLPLPIPVSLRVPSYADANEDFWQELVVRHLEIPDWERVDIEDQLDNVGPYARTVLHRFGVLWPFNAHFHLPVAERAAGGTVLTGFGGDELLSPSSLWHRTNRLLVGDLSWRPRDALLLVAAYGPRALRRVRVRRRVAADPNRPWLRPEAERADREAEIRGGTTAPVRWDDFVRDSWWPSRYRRIAESSVALVVGIHDAVACSPLTDPAVLASIALEGGRAGFRSRTVAMEHLVGDLLPAELLTRRTKAKFNGAFWNRHSREFVARWDGTGVDENVVDGDVLRGMWTGQDGQPDGRTFLLLQSVWAGAASP